MDLMRFIEADIGIPTLPSATYIPTYPFSDCLLGPVSIVNWCVVCEK